MPLAPGPFLQGSQADVATAPGVYDFTGDGIALAGELNAIASGWDAFFLDLADLALEPVDPTLGIDDAGLAQEIAYEQGIASLPGLDDVITAINTTDTLFNVAVAFAPAAAWTDPTTPFVPPDPTQTIVVPTVPLGDYNPLITGVVGGTPSLAVPWVTLSNVTRIGSQNFVVGDTFLVNVAAYPQQQVSADATLNGVELGTTKMGVTDSAGNWSISGTMGPQHVGGWLQDWYVAGQLVSTFSFIVTDG